MNDVPMVESRVHSAALWLVHHPDVTGMPLIQTLRQRYGLNAAEAMEARELSIELRHGWPIQGRQR